MKMERYWYRNIDVYREVNNINSSQKRLYGNNYTEILPILIILAVLLIKFRLSSTYCGNLQLTLITRLFNFIQLYRTQVYFNYHKVTMLKTLKIPYKLKQVFDSRLQFRQLDIYV